jgi:hypothetical protein
MIKLVSSNGRTVPVAENLTFICGLTEGPYCISWLQMLTESMMYVIFAVVICWRVDWLTLNYMLQCCVCECLMVLT